MGYSEIGLKACFDSGKEETCLNEVMHIPYIRTHRHQIMNLKLDCKNEVIVKLSAVPLRLFVDKMLFMESLVLCFCLWVMSAPY